MNRKGITEKPKTKEKREYMSGRKRKLYSNQDLVLCYLSLVDIIP